MSFLEQQKSKSCYSLYKFPSTSCYK